MRLYSGTTKQFIDDTIRNQIADKLVNSFFYHYRYKPSINEINSWRNSLRAVSDAAKYAEIEDTGVILEYQLPQSSKRLDVLFCGRDSNGKDNALITELKQWDEAESTNSDLVMTWVGGGNREVLHPSAQVGQYCSYLKDTHTAFYEDDHIDLQACSYLHNYHFKESDPLVQEKYRQLLDLYPLFSMDDFDSYIKLLKEKLSGGDGIEVLTKVEQSKYKPSKKLMEHVSGVIRNNSEYILLDEQLVVYDKVLTLVKNGFHHRNTHIVIVRGGPGTGKSVIALNLMADLLLQGYNAMHATGSSAFTETLRKVIGTRGSVQFKYFNNFTQTKDNEIDVLILDEAHRIRKSSNYRFMKVAERSNVLQIEELIRTGKVVVFFIDDNQVVRPDEVGSVEYIKEYAKDYGAVIHEYELEAQFRCAGSDGFINWINNTLNIKRTANPIWEGDENFEFKIFNTPLDVENAIRAKVAEGYSGRMTAGFCWKWSKELDENGMLINDVVIGDYIRPWNARPNTRGLAVGIPKSIFWAYDPAGIDQVGCIYTAQGFEFDYVGVIFGNDIKYDMDKQEWVGFKEHSHDKKVKQSGDKFVELVKNTYRVLLSRGLKGCYVYFMDEDTRRFFMSRMDINAPQ
jgi:uncharacterized protein